MVQQHLSQEVQTLCMLCLRGHTLHITLTGSWAVLERAVQCSHKRFHHLAAMDVL